MSRRRRQSALLHQPNGLPVLDRGAHRSPQHGACLMEYVSVLAGVRFNDHPRCTHPALARLARMVNDETIDPAARSALAVLAPDLIDIRSADPRVTLTVVACCLRTALTEHPHDRDLTQALARIESQLTRLGHPRARRWARWRALLWEPAAWSQHHLLEAALRHARRMPGPHRDDQLRELLERAVADCRSLLAPRPGRVARHHSSPPVTNGLASRL